MNESSSTKQTTVQTDQPIWVELSDEELSNVSGGGDVTVTIGEDGVEININPPASPPQHPNQYGMPIPD